MYTKPQPKLHGHLFPVGRANLLSFPRCLLIHCSHLGLLNALLLFQNIYLFLRERQRASQADAEQGA